MADKEVKVKITTEVDSSEVDSLEDRLSEDFKLNVNNDDLEDSKQKTEEVDTEISKEHKLPVDDTDLDGAKEKVDELSGTLDGISMLAVGEVLQQYGNEAENMAQEMNTAAISVGQLATQTGIAEPEMVNLINTISNATFPNDEAMMYVKSLNQIGVSGANLGKSATDLDKINDAFGMGAPQVNKLGQELSVLGVDMNNVSSSFNALAYANANTVGGMENYFSFLRKYDAEFNELGYNVDQASIIIAAATQKYGGGRAALTGLSDALKEANGDTRALEQALGIQAGTLDNASNVTGQYEGQLQALADEEMEHKTLLDQLGAAWEDLSLSLGNIASPFMGVIGLGGQIAGFGMQLNGTWELLSKFRNIGFISNLGSTVGSALSSLGGVFSSLWGVLMANPIILVVIAITALIFALIWAYNNVGWFRDMVNGAFQALSQFAGYITGAITGAIQWLGNLFQNFTSQLGLNTNEWVQAVLGFILFLPTLPLQIGVALANAIAKALGFKGNFVQSMVSAATSAVQGFANAIMGIPNAIQNCLNWAYNLIMNHPIVQAAIWLGNTVANAFSSIGLGQSSPGKIVHAMENELDWTEEAMRRSKLDLVASDLGSGIASSFGTPELTTGNSLNTQITRDTGNNTGNTVVQNITFEGCTFDKKERVNEVLTILEDYFKWDNETAGRTA